MNAKSIVVIGAPRSGTNMLRDALCGLHGLATWPCDEINYVWRHGNVLFPTDELPAELATTAICGYVNRSFDWVRRRYGVDIVVEKTTANCLRVEFVNTVLPDARFVYIYRDGLDVIASARHRWTAKLDLPYLARKARFVPMGDLPFYATRYLMNRFHLKFSGTQRLATWGPRFCGMDELSEDASLEELCARQWQRCVARAESALAGIPADRVVAVSYERFVRCPASELSRILEHFEIDRSDEDINSAVAAVNTRSVGRGHDELREHIQYLREIVGETLERTVQ
ncbi:MAG: sulfotransferase [Pseudomonadota bacterium]